MFSKKAKLIKITTRKKMRVVGVKQSVAVYTLDVIISVGLSGKLKKSYNIS